jgi:hypothetical protein
VEHAHNISVEKPEGKRLLGKPRLHGKKILERILGKQNWKLWTGSM